MRTGNTKKQQQTQQNKKNGSLKKPDTIHLVFKQNFISCTGIKS